MDLFKFLPLLMRILDILPKIQSAAKSGTNIFTLLQTFAPDLVSILTGVGSTLFPTLPPDSQAKAGSIMLDPTKTMWIQNAINTLGLANPALVVDGSYGAMTKAAVIAFQTAHNVTPADGWAGDITEAALRTELAKKAVPAPTTPTATGPTLLLAVPTP
jgi:peptidoglycan hydrolase-like protein with peptidoglycan-binding domain